MLRKEISLVELIDKMKMAYSRIFDRWDFISNMSHIWASLVN